MSSKQRPLRPLEIAMLKDKGNEAADWTCISVTDEFNPERVTQCQFQGQVSIGALRNDWLERDELALPIGLSHTFFYDCDIGDDAAIHHAGSIRNAEIGHRSILFKLGEIIGTSSDIGIRIDAANENGGRCIHPFPGMLPADAWLWSKYRNDADLMRCFNDISRAAHNDGVKAKAVIIGPDTLVAHSPIIRNIRTGPAARIRGANSLINIIIQSSSQNPSYIGEGSMLTNGIIGLNCRIDGAYACNFFLSDNTSLASGTRLFDSFLGPHSHLSCCEIRNALIFGLHEQHHSSFLCASVLKGQSNIPAGAVIGSNHNSRAADGEIVADRGFWPSLNVSLKHNSRFAAFTLLARANYPAELNIELPFCLVSNDESAGELKLLPGYWFRHNMYALVRNSIKSAARSKGPKGSVQFEHNWLAPDTADQMLHARRLLEAWSENAAPDESGANAAEPGMQGLVSEDRELLVPPNRVEAGNRKVRILHAGRAWQDYGRMIRYYAVRTILLGGGNLDLQHSTDNPGGSGEPWISLNGQFVPAHILHRLRGDVTSGKIADRDALHKAYRDTAKLLPEERLKHAYRLLHLCRNTGAPLSSDTLLKEALEIAEFIRNGVRQTRLKDFENPFRNSVYDSIPERDAVLGCFEDDAVVAEAEKQLRDFRDLVSQFLNGAVKRRIN